ncbi:MAG: SLBB domain-containing protein, partial [Terriglobales bacterium]
MSPDSILEIFRQSPGLLLAFKKTLVRKAYEQGRLLDPESLTDDAVFELVRSDFQIRVLATQEIEKRSYVKAKPTEQEAAANEQERSGSEDHLSQVPMTEAEYWRQRAILDQQRAKDREQLRVQQQQQQSRQQPENPSSTTSPGNAPAGPATSSPTDRSRQLLQAQAQQGDVDYPMTPISASDLPGLFSDSGMSGTNNTAVMAAAIRARESSGTGMETSSQPNAVVPNESASLTRPRQPTSTVQPNYSPTVIRHQPDPYADVPSLYDLYSQVSRSPQRLSRFGMDIFTNGTGNLDELPMDLPVGPEYVLGPGDTLKIDLWGGVSERLQRIVDRTGQISLPESGTVQVTGKTLGQVQEMVQAVLRTQFRDERADVSLARLRTVRVWVVGDVVRPGAYDISALSTALNAVYTAGGPTSRGSLRVVKHMRGGQVVQSVDLYDLILHGVRSDTTPLQAGDTIQVVPVGPEITVEGMVRRPAVYELRGESNLAEALDMAGGVLSTGTLRHIDVERVQAHEKKVMLSLDVPDTNDQQQTLQAMEGFKIQDGDVIRISPILPYSYKTVYLDGHVFHPGKYPYSDGMKVTDLIKSFADLLPEPSGSHAEIIRLEAPDYRPVVMSFNLDEVLSGKIPAPSLKAFDTVRIFGKYDFQDPPEIMVSGEVRDPGEHLTNGQTHLRDAVYLAGGLTPDAKLDDAQIYRKEANGELQILSVNLASALAGDAKENVVLQPRDRIIIQRDLTKVDPAAVTIAGSVARPGKYALATNMTATDLVRLAGGFTRGAYTTSANLSRYVVENGSKVLGENEDIPIGKAMAGIPDTDVRLMDGDVLAIRQLANWSAVGASVSVKGEVGHPATYGIEEGERLSSLLERAGGFTAAAYPYGAVLERVQVREFSEKSRQEMIQRIKASGTGNISSNLSGGEQAAVLQAAALQQKQVLSALETQPASGRLVIHVSADINRWRNTAMDVEVRAGDTVYIPK